MPFSTYAQLQTAIADWLARTDLTGAIPDMISLAEAEMKRELRRYSDRTTITISAEETTLPTDVAELRSISLESSSATQDLPFRIGTPEMVAERRARSGATTGRPDSAFLIGRTLVVSPTPDQSYTARIVYYAQLSPLSATNTSNDVLLEAPDAYLYGPLLHAEGYLEHDERIAEHQRKFDKAVAQMNNVREREEHNASIRDVRLPRVLG